MLKESAIRAHGLSVAELEQLRRDSLCPSERADAISYDWARIGVGIALAGGAYPLILATVWLAIGSVAYAWSVFIGDQYTLDPGEALTFAFAIGMYGILGGMIGVLWSGLVTVLTLPIVYLIAWSLELRASIVRVGAFAGGLVGFICVLPLSLSIGFDITSDLWGSFVFLLMGPALTTVVGQLGGAWGGGKSREAGPARDWQKYLLGPVQGVPPGGSESAAAEFPHARLQFRIRHLLWISVWLSILLTLIRLCGIRYALVLPLLVGWLLFQSATLWIGGALIQRLASWGERRRQSRST